MRGILFLVLVAVHSARPLPAEPYHMPKCGCVTKGACNGEVGFYTSQVIQNSDLVCGLRFETCCYDGPCPGVVDEFARAAACVPQEQCVRPYGVLPTDVRDFGTIAPCPGHGAVRCLVVNSAELLEFQTTLAAIEASQSHSVAQTSTVQVTPTHIDIPIVESKPEAQVVGTVVQAVADNRAPVPFMSNLTPLLDAPPPVPAVPITGYSSGLYGPGLGLGAGFRFRKQYFKYFNIFG